MEDYTDLEVETFVGEAIREIKRAEAYRGIGLPRILIEGESDLAKKIYQAFESLEVEVFYSHNRPEDDGRGFYSITVGDSIKLV